MGFFFFFSIWICICGEINWFEALLGLLGMRDNWASSTFMDNSLGTFRDKG